MTALALRALAFAERYGITIAVVASDRLSWQSRGPTPGRALEALKAAKGELIDLLVRYRLDTAGGLAGDDLLVKLRGRGFAVRRYGVIPALDDALGGELHRVHGTPSFRHSGQRGAQAEDSLAIRAHRAPDWRRRIAGGSRLGERSHADGPEGLIKIAKLPETAAAVERTGITRRWPQSSKSGPIPGGPWGGALADC